jgi:hypothetical protein
MSLSDERSNALQVALSERDLDFILANVLPHYVESMSARAAEFRRVGEQDIAEAFREAAGDADDLAERLTADPEDPVTV